MNTYFTYPSILIGSLSTTALLFWLHTVQTFRGLAAMSIALALVLGILAYRSAARGTDMFVSYMALLCAVPLGSLFLMSIAEWQSAIVLISIIAGAGVGIVLYQLGLGDGSTLLAIKKKPLRRMTMMLWVYVGFCAIASAFAISVFFPRFPFWILLIAVASVLGCASFFIWRLYYALTMRAAAVWILAVAIMMIEISWAIHLLPFGYFVLGLLVTWIWYILQLLLRFHLSNEGIIWKKQRMFLGLNTVLFILVMMVVRWI